eukprot:1051755-Prorocentrum_minimum.AAC.1
MDGVVAGLVGVRVYERAGGRQPDRDGGRRAGRPGQPRQLAAARQCPGGARVQAGEDPHDGGGPCHARLPAARLLFALAALVGALVADALGVRGAVDARGALLEEEGEGVAARLEPQEGAVHRHLRVVRAPVCVTPNRVNIQ